MSKIPIRREVLDEAARRAGWNAVHGGEHLRRGQFRPEGYPPYIYLNEDGTRKEPKKKK